ncbi:MAG: hypothetical protein HY907_08190 [Deltaproteobacteria bacterium]|nr:hypothetical protein [Deltaproteobacteria bacterium]
MFSSSGRIQVVAIGLFACLACGPAVSSTPPTPRATDSPPLPATPEGALSRAEELLESAGLTRAYVLRDDELARARAAGLDEATVVGLLERILAGCLAGDAECGSPLVPGIEGPIEPIQTVSRLIDLLGEIGGDTGLALLYRLDARGLYEAGMSVERILENRWEAERGAFECGPPAEAQVAAVTAGLDDFAVVRFRDGGLVAEAATEAERADLGYFLAAVSEAGPEVGVAPEGEGGSWTSPGPLNEDLERAREAVDTAKREGDLEGVYANAMAYLTALGYPGPLRAEEEDEYAWGGARFSYVMRDAALAAEALGKLDVAATLYRRADPGGGACGTSRDIVWQDQVEGLIRSEERQGRCRVVVAERLLGIDGAADANPELPAVYGTAALAEAGYDVGTLYRGALVTLFRDAGSADLPAALGRAPAPLGERARARLEGKGAEAWEARVHALEGYADVVQREALPLLRDLAAGAPKELRLRALRALAALAERPMNDPCRPIVTWGGSGGSNVWSREIRPLGRACESVLKEDEAAELAESLEPLLADRQDQEVLAAVVEAIGAVGSAGSLDALRELQSDPRVEAGEEICEETGDEVRCENWPLVVYVLEEAVAFIEEREELWAEQGREDAEGGEGAESDLPLRR